MKQHVITGSRLVMGLIFFVFGLNGFFQFLPAPPPSAEGLKFIMALFETGYMFPIIKGVEVLVGAMLLANAFVPLSLLLITPITLNIVLFHTILDPAGAGIAILLLVLHVILTAANWSVFKTLLKRKQ